MKCCDSSLLDDLQLQVIRPSAWQAGPVRADTHSTVEVNENEAGCPELLKDARLNVPCRVGVLWRLCAADMVKASAAYEGCFTMIVCVQINHVLIKNKP